tara:strand:+ start:1383 stop:2105 length:723 start_codon:yes stop_codon:yes gene_type:complete
MFDSTANFDEAMDVLEEKFLGLGFDRVDYAYIPHAPLCAGKWASPDVIARNFPRNWKQGWSRYSSADPFYQDAYRTNLPLDWDHTKQATWLSSFQRDAISYIEDSVGLADGITVPLHLSGGRFAFVSAATAQRTTWRRDRRTVEQTALVLAHSFHAHVSRFVCNDTHITIELKQREIECLEAAARGNSAQDTADEICRCVDTVRFHLKNASAKLGARNITHAVSIATAQGFLQLPFDRTS